MSPRPPPPGREFLPSPHTRLAGRRTFLVEASGEGGWVVLFHGPPLNLGLSLPPTDFAPQPDLGGETLPRAWLQESPLPWMPHHRALGQGGEAPEDGAGWPRGLGPGWAGRGQLLAEAAVPRPDTACLRACGAPQRSGELQCSPSSPASCLGKLDSLPQRNRPRRMSLKDTVQ